MTPFRYPFWFGAVLAVMPSMVSAQTIPRIQPEQLRTFSARIGGLNGALKKLEDAVTSSVEREAIADTVTALLNTARAEVPGFSEVDALTVLSTMADSKRPDNSAAGQSRLMLLAIRAQEYAMRLNGVSLIAGMSDHAQGARMLKQIVTSEADVAERAVGTLGGQYGDLGVTTLREIFQANSATNVEARARIDAYAYYFKWTRQFSSGVAACMRKPSSHAFSVMRTGIPSADCNSALGIPMFNAT